jgi:hypothetical protein
LKKPFYFLLSLFVSSTLSAAPTLSEGIDWSLPSYVTPSTAGGLVGELPGSDEDTNAVFTEIVWGQVETSRGQFNWSSFDAKLAQTNKNFLIRLEVNSKCFVPAWSTTPALANQSLEFWEPQYIAELTPFINAFANRYAANPRVIGVHLGIADGEFYQMDDNGNILSTNCPDDFESATHSFDRDGWGEFWMNAALGETSASVAAGLTVSNFKSSVENIINMYANAFGEHSNKLAFMSYGTSFDSGSESTESFNAELLALAQYSKSKGVGNREGEIEGWMRYTGNVYGVDFVTGTNTDGSCSMTFDETVADTIINNKLYWGDENEFYGSESWILESTGPLSNQPYRFYISSLRALQMRRNYLSIRPEAFQQLRTTQTEFNTGSFIKYLAKTLGRSRADTPDAFVLLGEKTLEVSSGLFPDEYKAANTTEECLLFGNNREGSYITVNEFGRWLSVVNPTEADPEMRKNMPESENFWGSNLISGRGNGEYYELYARKSKEMLFDINDQLMQQRCANGCNVEVKISFKDSRVMDLVVTHANGSSQVVRTQGDDKVRTASFAINSIFNNGYKNSDFSIKTLDGSKLSVLIARVNIVSQSSNIVPLIFNLLLLE